MGGEGRRKVRREGSGRGIRIRRNAQNAISRSSRLARGEYRVRRLFAYRYRIIKLSKWWRTVVEGEREEREEEGERRARKERVLRTVGERLLSCHQVLATGIKFPSKRVNELVIISRRVN